jgi:HlyD family secretion protein
MPMPAIESPRSPLRLPESKVVPPATGVYHHLLPPGEKVPEGRMRGRAAAGCGRAAGKTWWRPTRRVLKGRDNPGPAPLLIALGLLLLASASGCKHSDRGSPSNAKDASARSEEGKTAGIQVVKPEKRDIRMMVVQPGTIQAYEVTPIYSRISGYVEKYRYNIGDRVKAGDVLIDMWIPDFVEKLSQMTAAVKRAAVQIRVTQSAQRAAEASLETAKARIVSAKAGVERAQASYTRWESEYKRLEQLVTQRVLDVQVRDETYRQFEEAVAARDQANAMVSETNSSRDQAEADLERSRVDVEAARADLLVAQANEREARVNVEYGQIKAPYNGVITQRNVSPGDYLEPGGGTNGRPLFVLEQIDPVRVFVGVPELASFFIHDQDTALIRFQAIPGITREGKVIRSGFSMNPSTRTLQTEVDLPNSDGHLHPGWYVTVTIVIDRKQVWSLPSNAINFQGGQDYVVYLQIDGKPVRTPVIVGPSDDTHTEVLKKYVPGASNNPPQANTNAWPEFDGTERVLIGSPDVLAAEQAAPAKSPGAK